MLKKIISLLLSVLIIITALASCDYFPQKHYDNSKINQARNMLNEFESESDSNVVLVLGDGSIIVDGEKIDIKSIIERPIEAVIEYDRKVYCVGDDVPLKDNDDQYEAYHTKVQIYCVDIDTCETQTLYTHYLYPIRSEVPYVYGAFEYVPIDEGIAFYDGINTFLFDVKTHTVSDLSKNEFYSYVNATYNVFCGKRNDQFELFTNSFDISSAAETRTINIDFVMNKHEKTRDLMEFCLENELFISDSKEGIEDVFFAYVYTFDNAIYLNCTPFPSADLFFSYDFESDSIKLIYSGSDSLFIKLIPRIN